MIWTNQPLGSVMWGSHGIVDVLAISKSYSHPSVRIYEIKRDRGDFLHDVNTGKYLKYMEHCNQLFFAAPAGLIKKDELPEGCGLITQGPNGWRSVKVAPRRDFTMAYDVMMALMMKGYQNHFEEYRRLEIERFQEYPGLREASLRYGVNLSRDIVESREYIERAQKLTEEIEGLSNRQFTRVSDAVYWLQREVAHLLGKRKYAEEAARLVGIALQLFKGSNYRTDVELREIAEKLGEKKTDT